MEKKLQFLKKLRNKRIASKIIKSREFRDYDDFSLDACMMKALELEDEYQIVELFADDVGQGIGIEEESCVSEEVNALGNVNLLRGRGGDH